MNVIGFSDSSNPLYELAESKFIFLLTIIKEIGILERNLGELKSVVDEEKSQLDEIGQEIQSLKTKYDLKRQELQVLNSKVDEKTKLLNEAKKAYNKIKENTTRLIEAIDNENEEYSMSKH